MADSGAPGQSTGLSFGLASKKAAKKVAVNTREEPQRRELITGLESSKIQTSEPAQPAAQPKAYVIPKLENTFSFGGKKAPSFVPPSSDTVPSGEEKFELAAPSESAIKEYGLQRRARPLEQPAAPSADAPRPPNGNGGAAKGSYQERELAQYKEDLTRLPEVASVDAYEAMPVEEFGKAMLLGMGWQEGQGVGRSRRPVESRQYVRRPDRLGLGAQPAAAMAAGKAAQGDKANGAAAKPKEKEGAAAPRPSQDPSRDERREPSSRGGGDREEREPSSRGGGGGGGDRHSHHRDSAGHSGRGRAPGTSEPDRRRDSSHRHRDDAHPSHRPESGRRDSHRHGSDRRDEAAAAGAKRRRRRSSSSDDGDGGGRPRTGAACWLYPNISVRIVDKSLKSGKVHLKKGVVVDVQPGLKCDVVLHDTSEVLHLRQSSLETVVPREAGAALLLVRGAMAGQKARLLSSSTSAGVAAVQLASDMTVQRLMLDDVAAYVGPLDDDDE